MEELRLLRRTLRSVKNGAIRETRDLERLLAVCWHDLDGADQTGMDGGKLIGRMEAVSWEAPILTFKIERHGATMCGSTRADVYTWRVDVNAGTAETDELMRWSAA
jgi:hypothetical protein